MDPVTGIGLVAAVIQLVKFGVDTVDTIRQVYQQGSASKYDDVEYTTNHLADLTRSLQQSLKGSAPQQSLTLSRTEKDLVDLGKKCEDCAGKLQHELRKLHSQPKTSVLAATRKAVRGILKQRKIDEISKDLATYRATLETSLLYRLSQQFEIQGLRTDKRFASLDGSLQHVIVTLANSQTSLATLAIKEADQTRSHTATQIHQLQQLHLDDRLYDQVTKSLFYPDIFSRQEQVDHNFDGIENSYEWIFREPRTQDGSKQDHGADGDGVHAWDDFAEWLKSGQGLYWINGKAGSGKSTLMNYICQHSSRLDFLTEWCADRLLLTPAYFFWAAGSRQQKSIDGLLRSLIYQMLTECRELVQCLEIEPLHAWTESRLINTLRSILNQSQIPVAICMFIDGLDEIDERYDSLVKMIKLLMDQENVKICLSSRPLQVFEEAFSGAPGLRLQDLTSHGIRAYADVQLFDSIQERALHDKTEGYRATTLADMIVRRADGVFLWAVIAVRNVRDGLRDLVDLDELAQSIDNLPSQLEDLFMTMLNRIKPPYQRDAARFLQIALCTPLAASSWEGWHSASLNLCRLHLIYSQRDSEDAPVNYGRVATSVLLEACETTKTRLVSHTAGLLELTPWDNTHPYQELKPRDEPILNARINFVHRTARDFLSQNPEARSFLARKGSTEAQVHLSIARGILAQLAQFSGDEREYNDSNFEPPEYYVFGAALQHISLAERLVGASQSNLMRSLVYGSCFHKYSVPADYPYKRTEWARRYSAYWEDEFSIDVVGMAATMGMTLYVCERLDTPNASRHYAPDLPDLSSYCKHRATPVTLTWARSRHFEGLGLQTFASELQSSSYRQTLSKYLQLDPNEEISSLANTQRANAAFAETYLLSCCTPSCQDLVRIMLHAGANPMVQAEIQEENDLSRSFCFWGQWLRFFEECRYNYIRVNGSSGGIVLDDKYLDLNITPKTVFDTTKALLAHGADVNFPLRGSPVGSLYLERRSFQFNSPLHFYMDATAMFLLEECFNKEPEFREFAIAIESAVKKPIRWLTTMAETGDTGDYSGFSSVDLGPEDSDRLWPFIEEWERTGHNSDLAALQKVMKQIWEAHAYERIEEGWSEYEDDDDEEEEGYDKHDDNDDGKDDDEASK